MSGKRESIFAQGKPESPYDEKVTDEDMPKRATAAQMASRKMKTLRTPRRAGAPPSGLSQSTGFGLSQQPNFAFGASAPSDNASNPFGFQPQQSNQSTGAFGNNATSSFPPAQAPAPSNSFATSSFPSFGANNATEAPAFNPQPPSTSFNFSTGNTNPFAASNTAPTVNGSNSAAFSGSIFSFGGPQSQPQSQPESNLFGGAVNTTTASAGAPFGTTATSQNNLFSATTGAPSTNLFGSIGAPAAATTNGTSEASTPNLFSSVTTTSQPFSFSTPAKTNNAFGGLSTTQPASIATPAPASNPFASLTTTSQPTASSTNATASDMFPSTNSASGTPKATPFGGFNSSTPAQSTGPFGPGKAASQSNAFGGFGVSENKNAATTASDSTGPNASAAPSTNMFGFGSTPKATPKAPASATPQTNIFSGFGSIKSSTPGMFAQSQPQAASRSDTPVKNANAAAEKKSFGSFASSQPQSSLFTPQKEQAQSASPKPETAQKAPFSFTPQPQPSAAATTSMSKDITASAPVLQPQGEAQNPFARLSRSPSPTRQQTTSTPTSAMPSLTGASRPPEPVTSTQPTTASEVPRIPKVIMPKHMTKPVMPQELLPVHLDEDGKKLVTLASQIAVLNQRFKEKLADQPLIADWSAMSKWHYHETKEITANIATVRKHRAAAMGITGNESVLSKRKATEDEAEIEQSNTPSKKVRSDSGANTTVGQTSSQSTLFSQAPKPNPPTQEHSKTSNLFGSVLSKSNGSSPSSELAPSASPVKEQHATKTVEGASPSKVSYGGFKFDAPAPSPSEDSNRESTNTFARTGFKASAFGSSASGFQASTFTSMNTTKDSSATSGFQAPAFGGSSTAKDGGFNSGFQPPSFGGSTTPKDAPSSSGFQVPSFGTSTSKTASAPTGFQVPSFGSSGASGFMSQFSKKAKSAEELTAERKKKAMDEDYDSDDETKAEWSARWDKQEAERLAQEKKKVEGAPSFKVPTSSTDAASGAKSPFSLSKPTSGSSTPGGGLFGSRLGSPAPSGGLSVFDTPQVGQSPSPNIFGHLSPNPYNNSEESDEDDQYVEDKENQETKEYPEFESTTPPPPKRKAPESDDGSDETLEQTMRRKKQDTKPSLLSRISRGGPSEATSTDEGSDTRSNGAMETPKPKFGFFDFSKAGPATAPSLNTSGGDQTFKVGSPIKFSTPGENKENKEGKSTPLFSFQPATPSPAEFAPTPKAAPFAFLGAANPSQSGPGSIASSVFSSRAATPLSETETSGKDSAADNEDDEANKGPQLDLSQLTDDEKAENAVLFETPQAIAKHLVDKQWTKLARGPLWVLRNKETGKAFIRMRIQSGATPVNYGLLPKLEAKVAGSTGKQAMATRPAPEGGLESIYFALQSAEVAEEFVETYNANLP